VAWKKKGWKKADGSRAKNEDLWEILLALLDAHEVEMRWVKGHNGHDYNERCDALATARADAFRS
jgi:ribonuclease HI